MLNESFVVIRHAGYCAGRFAAMASPCEVLIDGDDLALATRVTRVVHDEARRIERKYSRYRDDSAVSGINAAGGMPVSIDEETHRLLNYADTCHRLSGGAFDITSGVLRRAWCFDGSDRVPSPEAVCALLPCIGWERVDWRAGLIRLPAGMEIDLGGIVKEYAADRALARAMTEVARVPMLVNFGGDLATNGALAGLSREWRVGVESPDGGIARVLSIQAGAMATSGDARRFLLSNGERFGHVLDARRGWPPPGAPRSVTVVATSCVEAGSLATMALLQGAGAGEFLVVQGVQHWILW